MKKNKTLIATALFLIISIVGVAQQFVTPPAPDERVPPPGLPIDGGILVLVVLGLFYGVYKLLSKSKASNI